MKTNFIISCFIAILLFSCESKEQDIDDAFAQVKEEKMLLEDSINDAHEMIEDTIQTTVVKIQQITINDWSDFMLEIDKKIKKNEQTIVTIKSTPNYSIKLFKKVASLEETNNNLKIKIAEYQKNEKLKRKDFKETILLEAIEIDTQLNEMNSNENK